MDGPVAKFSSLRRPVWTENKARLIERYLYYFVLVTKHGVYIDGFAGPQEPDKPEMWAAKLVLESEPRWLRSFFLCDSNREKVRQLENLKNSQPIRQPREPKRTIEIFHADFNNAVNEIISSDQIGDRTATFCLLDQRTFECQWQTIRTLAFLKQEGMKIEQFYFLGSGWLDRAFSGIQDETKVKSWWGESDWKILHNLNSRDRAALFCGRFKEELGYNTAHTFPILGRKGSGKIMYHMIHATDHPEAPNLMCRAYRKAVSEKEPMEQLKFEFEKWRQSGS